MDIPSGKWSTGAIMRVIIPIVLELVAFEGAWTLVLFAPVTMAILTMDLALAFVLVRPRSWRTCSGLP